MPKKIASIESNEKILEKITSSKSRLKRNSSKILFYNGHILTMDKNHPTVEAVAIDGDSIVAAGNLQIVSTIMGSGALMFDLEGRTLMPGFVDSHTHWFNSHNSDYEHAQNDLLTFGVTTVGEMNLDEGAMRQLTAFGRSRSIKMRISLYPALVDCCGEVLGEWYLRDYPVSLTPGALLQIPGVKIFNDGGGCKRPAKSFAYSDGTYGDLYFQAEELSKMIRSSQKKGYQTAIHGLGDRAIETIMDAYKLVLGGNGNPLHHRIEHNTLVRDNMLPRYSELGIAGTIFGYFPTSVFTSGQIVQTPQTYAHWEWRWRSLIDANPGAHFAWHSDAPGGVPGLFSPVPMLNIHGFVTRREPNIAGQRPRPVLDWAADDKISVEEALSIMTIESAYALRRDHEIGSLEGGKLADLIILSKNPLTVNQSLIPGIKVLMTMVDGKMAYCHSSYRDACENLPELWNPPF